MSNQYNNKIVLEGGEVLIDLSSDTADTSHVDAGYTFHDKTGAPRTGTSTKDIDSSGVDVSVSEILLGKTAAARGAIITGTMPNNGAVTGVISTKNGDYTVPTGFHDGSGKVGISSTEKNKLIPENIREGVTILGVVGEMSGSESEISETTKTVNPSFSTQNILPSTGFTCMKEVIINPIKVTRTDNAAGGVTIIIG